MEEKYIKQQELGDVDNNMFTKLNDKYNKSVEHAIALYKKWSIMKKCHVDFDKQMLISLKDMGVPTDIFKGHIFMVPKSKCKGTKHPYNIS